MLSFNPQGKLLKHFDRVHDWLQGINVAPILVEISPTYICNATCHFCFYVEGGVHAGTHSRSMIPRDIMLNTLKDMSSMGVKAISWSGGGDPSIYPFITESVDLAYDLGAKQGMFTNGYDSSKINNPGKFEWIRISLTPKYFNDNIGANVLKNVNKYSEKTITGVNLNYYEESVEFVTGLALKSKEAGAHYFQIRPSLASPGEKQKVFRFPSEIIDLETDEFKIITTEYKWRDYLTPRTYDRCYGPQFTPSIWPDGKVMTCNYHPGKDEFTFGDLYKNTFEEIWHSEKKRAVMDNLKGDMLKNCQNCCKPHEINKMLYFIKNEELNHVEFI